jgi:hypothetical protein
MADVRTLNPTAVVRSSETTANVYRTARRHTPEDSALDVHHYVNLSSVYTDTVIPRRSFHTGNLARHISRKLASQKVKILHLFLGFSEMLELQTEGLRGRYDHA